MADDQHGNLPQPPAPPPSKDTSLEVAEHEGSLEVATSVAAQGRHSDTPTAPALHSAKEKKEQPESQHQGSSAALSAAPDQGSSLAANTRGMADDCHLLVQVLSYLAPQEYLHSCSLVCHAWHVAAAQAAAQDITIDSDPDSPCSWREQLFTPDRRARFALWLCKHGPKVQRVHIDARRSRPRPVWSLPIGQLQRLQQLVLVNCQLEPLHASCSNNRAHNHVAAAAVRSQVSAHHQQQQMTLHSSAYSSNEDLGQASLSSLTSLRRLSLHDVNCHLGGGLAGLSALTNLQMLWLAGTTWPHQQQQQQAQQQLSLEFLSSLTQLTQLALNVARLPIVMADASACLQHISSLTQLHDLRLHGVTGQKQQQDLRSLAALTNLKVLELVGDPAPDQPQQQQHGADDQHYDQQQQQHAADDHHHDQQQQQDACNEFGVFSALMQLTQLDLHAVLLPTNAAAALACLQHLQVLRVYCGDSTDAAALEGPPQSITQLLIVWDDDRAPFGSSSVPALATSLPALQVLDVSAVASSGLQVGLCSSMSQLRKLRLLGAFHNALSSDLLHVVSYLPDLDELSITVCDLPTAPDRPRPLSDLSRYSELLASTPNLTQLSFVWLVTCMLPFGCGRHLFADGVQLPQLKQLVLGAPLCAPGNPPPDFFSEDHWGFHAIEATLGPGDVARLVRCCPALELLSIPGLVQPRVDMSPLKGLTRLRQLYVGGRAIDDMVAQFDLAQLPQLRHLEVCGAPQLTDAGVFRLSRHTGLTELLLVGCGLSSAMPSSPCGGSSADGAKCFRVRQQAGGGLVCKQLLEFCSRSDALNWMDSAAACDGLLAHTRERKYGVSGPTIGTFMFCTEQLLSFAPAAVTWIMQYAWPYSRLAVWGGKTSLGTLERLALYAYASCCVPACALFAWVVQVHVLMLVTGGWRAGWLCSSKHDLRCHLIPAALAAWWPVGATLVLAIAYELFLLFKAFALWISA